MQIVAALLVKLHVLAFLLNLWTYAAKDSLSFCWLSMKQLTDVWISELQIFKWRRSLISSQLLSKLRASDINVQVNPLDLACANLILLSLVKLAAVSTSINQSSKWDELLPLKIVICSRVFVKVPFFCAVHNISVYCCRTSPRGSGSADGWSAKDNLWSSCSKWFMASVGWPSVASTLCCKWLSSLVRSLN